MVFYRFAVAAFCLAALPFCKTSQPNESAVLADTDGDSGSQLKIEDHQTLLSLTDRESITDDPDHDYTKDTEANIPDNLKTMIDTPLKYDVYIKAALASAMSQMSAYNLLWVDPAKKTFIPLSEDIRKDFAFDTTDGFADFMKTPAVKFSKEMRSKGYINVWDYLMFSQLYAFDFGQQQDVINAFYADHKLYSGDRTPFNSNDPADCSKWRPQLTHDPVDGTHCLACKMFTKSPFSNGR